jgi:hypothetical protein
MIQHEWLDTLLCRQISGLFADDWMLEHVITESVDNEKHGECVRCTYRFVWNPDLESQDRKLPNPFGPSLMRLIKNAAKRSKAELVQTKIRGSHDFCDWGWQDEDTALMWIYLEASPRQ